MGNEIMLRQVLLRTESPTSENGYLQDVFWIDNKFATLGKKVQDEDDRIWIVAEVYNAKPFEDVDKQREAWKRWSDVLDGH